MPPARAQFYFGAEDAKPCRPEDAYLWTWEHGPEWYYAVKVPVPEYNLAIRPGARSRCPQCGEQKNLKVVQVTFSNGTEHLRCDCGRCGKFVSHLGRPPKNLDVIFVAK